MGYRLGVVLGPEPEAGAEAPTVPVITGLAADDALELLQELGFDRQIVFADVDPGSSLVGIVVTQSPPSGTRLDAGDVVTIQTARPDRSPRSGWPIMKKDEQGLFRAIEHLYD